VLPLQGLVIAFNRKKEARTEADSWDLGAGVELEGSRSHGDVVSRLCVRLFGVLKVDAFLVFTHEQKETSTI